MLIHHKDNDLYSKSIMIVDDEIDIITVIKHLLQVNNNNNSSFHVYGFTNPFLALDHLKLNYKDYVLVISDIKMRPINGFEFIRRVREIHPTVKVLLMSALNIDNDLFDSFQVLASSIMVDGFIQKPISMRNLNEIVVKTILGLKTIQEGSSAAELSSSQMHESQPKQAAYTVDNLIRMNNSKQH